MPHLKHRLRAWLLKREINQLIRRATAGRHQPSAHLVSGPAPIDTTPDFSRSGWFLVAVIVAAMLAGYVIADDARIDAANACFVRR